MTVGWGDCPPTDLTGMNRPSRVPTYFIEKTRRRRMGLKQVYERWTSINLVIRILAGLLIGAVLALAVPGLDPVGMLGTLFVNALKAIAPILVMILVMSALANSKPGLGSKFTLVLALYIGSTVVAATVAVLMSYMFPLTVTLIEPGETQEVVTDTWTLISGIIIGIFTNPVTAIIDGNYLSILFWAALFGIIMKTYANETTKSVVSNLSEIVTLVIRVVIQFAPIGIMGLIYETVSTHGLEIFAEYGALIALLVGCMLIVILITNPVIGAIFMRRNPYPLLFRCLRDSAVTAFFTRSSAANIPVNLALCEKMGLSKDFYSVSIPLGATINMNGAAITITIMTLCAAFTLGMDVPVVMALLLCIISTIAACGASGISGGSLLLIPLACSMLNIGDDIAMQMVAIGFIIGVIQDSLETALNSSADVYFTTVAEVADARKRGEELDLRI